MSNTEIDYVVFDVGGVLVEIIGGVRLLEWTDGRYANETDLFHAWICSPAVQKFERGHGSMDQFTHEVIEELALPVSAEHFIEEFTRWPNGLLDGAAAMLDQVKQHRPIACLSNTNDHHWMNQKDSVYLNQVFDQMFLSYQMSMVKPDLEIYHQMINTLDLPAENILFIDDNKVNVDAAKEVGLTAFLAKGTEHVTQVLNQYDCLSPKK